MNDVREKKLCKYCAEEIYLEANLCRFCNKKQENVISRIDSKLKDQSELHQKNSLENPFSNTSYFWLLIWIPTIIIMLSSFWFKSVIPVIIGGIYWSIMYYKYPGYDG